MFGDLKDMMGKLHEAQQQAEEIKKRLDDVHLRESDGEITITITGNREIKDVEVVDSLLEDKDELQDKLVLALNRAIKKADETHEKEMQSVAKGMMPGTDLFK